MKLMPRLLVMIAIAIAMVWVVAFARELGAREAREKIAAALNLDKPDRVHVKNISVGPGRRGHRRSAVRRHVSIHHGQRRQLESS